MPENEHTEILDSLAELRNDIKILAAAHADSKGDIKVIIANLAVGETTMRDHEVRIKGNAKDINGLAEISRVITAHLDSLIETMKDLKPLFDFLCRCAKIVAYLSVISTGVYAIFQMFPKGKTP